MMVPVWLVVVLSIIVAILLAVSISLGVNAYRRSKKMEQINQREEDNKNYAFILNPSKPNAEKIRQRIYDFFTERGLEKPLIIDTKLDKDGAACAREALAAGIQAVIAVGGDGTVRTAASAMAGTDRIFGIIPIGTANLFARNIGIPLGDIDAALQVAISRGARRVDVGRMALLDSKDPEHRHCFLIIGGVGFDAQMIDATDPQLKKNIGWFAYFLGGMKTLLNTKLKADIDIYSKNGTVTHLDDVALRSFLAGNCGEIPGLSLMPTAVYDDGLLDFAMLDTNGGIIGWADLFRNVVQQTITRKPARQGNLLSDDTSSQTSVPVASQVEQLQGTKAVINLRRPTLAQVDGDVLGRTQHAEITVDQQALIVRVPVDS
ncbi:MAG: diacylglycerol kinase [Oscillospiraceae bacterium]|jgi:diacylglycerol kinase family enzyme|nr:diacylglycerol kinase [Oscillospiraceae bacterium]